MKSKLNFRKKAIEPLIAAILLIVVAVILITIVLNWGKMFTTDALGKAKVVELTQSDAESFIYPKSLQDGILQFIYSPQSNFGEIVIESYKVLSDSGESLDTNLASAYTLKQGTNVISLTDFSSLGLETNKKVTIILQTTNNQYVSIKNITNKFTKTSETSEAPEVPLSSEKNINSFTINDINGIINQDLNTIAFELEFGTDVTSLTPTITISEYATIYPASGDAQNFTDSVTYTVTAEDDSTKTYTVSIIIGSESIVDANLPYVMFGDSNLYIQPDQNTTQMNWTTAVAYCDNLDANGYDDWYLPSITQLAAIWEACSDLSKSNTCMNDAIGATHPDFVSLMSDYYWSSTEYGADEAYFIDMMNTGTIAMDNKYTSNIGSLLNGDDESESNSGYVRCVRDFVDSVDPVDPVEPVDLPYVMFGDSKLYIQPSGSNEVDGTGDDDSQFTWDNAMAYCEGLDAHGYDDWYLPSMTQLAAIWNTYTYQAEDSCLNEGKLSITCVNNTISATNTNFVSLMSDFYWSSTKSGPNDAYLIVMYFGAITPLDKRSTSQVRCVRDFVDSVDPVDPVDLPYVIFEDRALYIQKNQPADMNWTTAVAYCEGLDAHGYSDWYLPSKNQLVVMWEACLEQSKSNECMNDAIGETSDYFVSLESDYYWSSTEYGTVGAYRIDMDDGFIIDCSKVFTNYVRCVRNFVDSVDPVDPVDIPYVIFEDRALYIQPDQNTTQMIWTNAVAYCEGLDAHGYSDWYLPNIDQLEAIWNACPNQSKSNSCMNDAIGATSDDFVPFINAGYYLSSTEYGAADAYGISMGSGGVNGADIYIRHKDYVNGRVRCVRD